MNARLKSHIAAGALLVVSLLVARPADAVTHEVSTSGELSAAIGAAAAGDIIELAAGSYDFVDGTVIDVDLTLRGATGNPDDVVVRLSYLSGGIIAQEGFASGDVLRFADLSFRYFHVMDQQLLKHSGPMEIVNCVFEDNLALELIVGDGDLLVQDSIFRGNTPSYLLVGQADLTISGCLFDGNAGSQLIKQAAGFLQVSQTSMIGNHGICAELSMANADFSHCLISGNYGAMGGIRMVFGLDSELTMDNCTLRDNQFYQGALYLGPLGQATLVQCDIRDNYPLDGTILVAGSLLFQCCDIDLQQWEVMGSYEVDNEGCGVAAAPRTLDGIKALYLR